MPDRCRVKNSGSSRNHDRRPTNRVVTISLPREDVEAIDARARALGMSRSAYLVQIARSDLATRGPLLLREKVDAKP